MKIGLRFYSWLNNILWLIFLGFLYLVAIVFNQIIFWTLFYFMTILLLFCFISLIKPLPKVPSSFPDEVIYQAHDPFILSCPLAPQKFSLGFYSILEADLSFSQDQSIPLKNYTSESLEWSLDDLNRGLYTQASIQLVSKDFLGLLRKTTSKTLSLKLIVLPEKKEALTNKIIQRIATDAHTPIHEEELRSYQLKTLRDYHVGDHYNEIDWKLSAKKQKLMIKEVEKEKKEELISVFWGLPSKKYEESLSVFFTFVTSSQKKIETINHYLFSGNNHLIKEPNLSDFSQATPLQNETEALNKLSHTITTTQTILLFTTIFSDNLSDFLAVTPHHILVIVLKERQKIDFYYSKN